MRLRKKPWIGEAIKEYSDIVAEAGCPGGWHEVFGRRAPLRVELGTGKGHFLSELALVKPAINFVGIEAERDIIFYAAQKMRDKELANVRLLHFDAGNITAAFDPGEVERLYINFCDPWPKSRHAKRRLTHARFLAMYKIILIPGGRLCFKTDNADLFAFSLEQATEAGLGLENVTYDLHAAGAADNIMTEYEAKFSGMGQKIFACEMVFV